MYWWMIFDVIIVVANLTFGVLSKSIDKTPVQKDELQRKKVNLDGNVLDLRYLARNSSKLSRFFSEDTLFYDPVFENHTVLADALNKKEDKDTFGMELDGSSQPLSQAKKVKCSGLCKTSICPWTVEIDRDEDRVPVNIAYARCKTGYCDVGFTGMSARAKFEMEIDTYCEILHTKLYATINGKDEWLENWPIACLCVRAYTQNPLLGRGKHGKKKKKFTAKTLVKDMTLANEKGEEALNLRTVKEPSTNTFEKKVIGKATDSAIEPEKENNHS